VTHRSLRGLHRDIRLHRVRNKALLVGGVVHLGLCFARRFFRTGICNSWMQDHRTHPEHSVFVLGHQPDRFVFVVRDLKALS